MNFLKELHERNITWLIAPVVDKVRPDSLHKRLCFQVTVQFPEGAPLVKVLPLLSGEPRAQHLLIQAIRGDERVKDLMRQWYDSQGNVPVVLVDRLVEDHLVGELVHVALRKCADSKQSSISWNALHQLRSEDRIEFWGVVEAALVSSFASRKGKVPPTRRQVANELREAVLKHFEHTSCSHYMTARGRRVERKPEHRFALIALHCACELTEMDEWLWGWLGYVLNDVERIDAADSAEGALA